MEESSYPAMIGRGMVMMEPAQGARSTLRATEFCRYLGGRQYRRRVRYVTAVSIERYQELPVVTAEEGR